VARAIRINGELQGIIISNIDIKRLDGVLPATRTGKSSKYGLVDKNGRIVYANDSKGLLYDERTMPKNSDIWKALNGEIYRYKFKISDFDGKKQVGVDYPIKDIGWSCYATSPISEITGVQIKRVKNDLMALILVYIVSFVIAFLIGKQHIYSINKIKDATNKALYKDKSYKTDRKRVDEYEEVVDAFNQITKGYNQKINEVEEYSNLKANFMATMSHELKTPLNIILGCVQLMEMQVTDNEAFKKYLKMLKQNSFRLLRLINNFIDINKIEVENLTINLVNDDIIRVIEDISLSIVEYTSLKNIEIIFDTEVEEKYMAFDHDKIERILLNLLSNSIKFTEAGGIIMINIYDKDDHMVISVKDNGIGIPEEMQDKIFDRFVQVDSTLRRRAEGSGIGLSLVKSLVELHEGRISVKSELGKGSEFIIELPIKQVERKLQASIDGSLTNVEKIKIEFSDIYT
jgi:signal transduction histidine kinase